MTLAELDYDLPEELIAQKPLENRANSRLLHLDRVTGKVSHTVFGHCGSLLEAGDLLVLNDTRVTAFRLFGHKSTGGRVEVLAMDKLAALDYRALIKPARSIRPGSFIRFSPGLGAEVFAKAEDGSVSIRFDSDAGLAEATSSAAATPLPPYIRAPIQDSERYQTVYAEHGGSAAAPTAGLHFTHDLLTALRAKGVETATVTLDVGTDTFRPMASEPERHEMHGERCTVPAATAAAIEACRGRIVAVGTTTVRTLESFAVERRRVVAGSKTTKLLIAPGYEFKVVDGMFTNFHMPRTTMLLMIAVLASPESVRAAYAEAVRECYRFLSFGDSMLIL